MIRHRFPPRASRSSAILYPLGPLRIAQCLSHGKGRGLCRSLEYNMAEGLRVALTWRWKLQSSLHVSVQSACAVERHMRYPSL